MAPELRHNREKRRSKTKEDIKNLIEEVWGFGLDETFYKIFSRQASKGTQDVIDLTKEELKELTWIEDNGDASKLDPVEQVIYSSITIYT